MLVPMSPMRRIQQVESGRLSRAIYQSRELEKCVEYSKTFPERMTKKKKNFHPQNNLSSIVTTLELHDEHMKSNPSTVITVIGEVFLISLLCKLYPYLLGTKFVSRDFLEVFHSFTLAALLEVSLSSLDTWDGV